MERHDNVLVALADHGREPLTFEETDRFLRAAAPEWKVSLATALETGLRLGELLALKWQDVDLVAVESITANRGSSIITSAGVLKLRSLPKAHPPSSGR